MESTIGAIIVLVIYIPFLILWIYICVLFIKIARRGIKALDIFLAKNSNDIMNK